MRITCERQFGPEEIDELLDLQYGKPRTFVTLALPYPKFSFETEVHVDHVFPQAPWLAVERRRRATARQACVS